jgi:hypothetical protein
MRATPYVLLQENRDGAAHVLDFHDTKGAAALDQSDLLAQQLCLDAQARHHRLQPPFSFILDVDLTALDARFAGSQKPIPPIAQGGNCHPILSRSTLEVRSSQKLQNHYCLASR